MSWKQFVREIERATRRAAKARAQDLARRQREQEKSEREQLKAHLKQEELRSARNEVHRFEEYLVHLQQLHHRCKLHRDWAAVLSTPVPPPPARKSGHEIAARRHLEEYRPGLFARLTGKATRQRLELAEKIEIGKGYDDAHHGHSTARHLKACEAHERQVQLARAVLSRDPQGFSMALKPIQTLRDFKALGLRISIREVDQGGVAIDCDLTDAEVVATPQK